ncbi:hypothetical protein [Tengunoibacter tsumagoiensis]|uniref:Lipoprotein n=1 Tax=Tengunoibacter tsumagoiensis TaxID=2014871 RepID=A0A402A5I3_9CHLR|nr:hypothetical protein [Tengunoibacter tsumagoiensis]GCE14360.1 hypothetical protein KTT_42190 [Tengunoibacter tsumagoiensis]
MNHPAIKLLVIAPFIGTLLLLVTACGPTPSPSPTTTGSGNYGTNLIVNPGAENGPSDAKADKPVSKIPGWTLHGDLDVVPYGVDGVTAASDPGPSDRGKNLFTGGPDSPIISASQTIDISSDSSDIAKGSVTYTLSGYLGGFSGQDDNAILAVQFQDTSNKVLAQTQIGPIKAADRQNATELLQRTATGKIPVGTVKLVVTLTMNRTDGAYNDGYADSLSLILQNG